MASHFRWYGSESQVTVPWNARYSYPSQANQTSKTVPRIPPKNKNVFLPGDEIRIEIPAQGYLNPAQTTLEFDVVLKYTPTDLTRDASIIRFQNNIQSIFDRVRIMYGSTPLEDINSYGLLTRCLTEWTATNQQGSMDQTSILEGIGKGVPGTTGWFQMLGGLQTYLINPNYKTGIVNARQSAIQGISLQQENVFSTTTETGTVRTNMAGNGFGAVPNNTGAGTTLADPYIRNNREIACTRRYQVQLNSGLLQQGKLIPIKYMASQLAIMLTVASAEQCIHWQQPRVYASDAWSTPSLQPPTFEIRNVNFIPEILEFDSSYDNTFLQGLASGGVPIKFASWNTFRYSLPASTQATFTIPERNRSIKGIFAVVNRTRPLIDRDSGATMFTCHESPQEDSAGTLQEFQYRIGGRMFPASPVQCATEYNGKLTNGGSEAYAELSKALNILGDYRLSTSTNILNWAVPQMILQSDTTGEPGNQILLPEYDTKYSVIGYLANSYPMVLECESSRIYKSGTFPGPAYQGRCFAGNISSCCFAMAQDLETSSGMEISGLNAEEQSDISFTARWDDPQSTDFSMVFFTYFDSMIVLHENNVLELIK